MNTRTPGFYDATLCGQRGWRAILLLSVLSVCVLAPALPVVAQANKTAKKPGSEPEVVTGKITQVEKKGKTAILSIEKEGAAEGEAKLEVLLTPTINFGIHQTGDSNFLRPNVMISGQGAAAKDGKSLSLSEVTVHIGYRPNPQVVREFENIFQVCGQIVGADAMQKNFLVNFGQGPPMRVTVEMGATIKASTQDTDIIPENAKVTVEGITRGGKFLVHKVTVKLDSQLTAEEAFNPKKKIPMPAAKKEPTPKAAPKGAPKAKDAAVDPADPFGDKKKKAD